MAKTKIDKEKPLEKMTAKELRELAIQLPEITGVHGLNKAELISEIKKARGIPEDAGKKSNDSNRETKDKIRDLRVRLEAYLKADDSRMAGIFKKRINQLKKKTRREA
ncbi:MAG: Rho termination factor N-terminal domain-containing protein [Desulfobacterales bacterium]|nr:Rho termination factor N-terminal domain-containing protein [Desulfobacterales bacterium]MDD4071823.1 Rho termination factor N-terminal domain-containing protein [Desulfobacterales bacterium]MDD4392530.1 Rho termination factor N-terminal domain-containing protein [Desulfobacterales bacterium]